MLSKTFRAVLWPWACTLTLLHSATALAQPAVPVTVAMPTAAESERHVALTGSFIARRVAALSPRVPGLVAGVRVDAGDRVTAGDVLLELDGRLAALAVARAEAGVAEQRAALAE
ncbi:MAG: biotin/lipoyl-binding protein, partial [Pseudomonadales bacterium]